MAILKLEITNCMNCPCLRNNGYGEFVCFMNDGLLLKYYELDEIPEHCPLEILEED